jgi:hypothetical protein
MVNVGVACEKERSPTLSCRLFARQYEVLCGGWDVVQRVAENNVPRQRPYRQPHLESHLMSDYGPGYHVATPYASSRMVTY